MSHPDTFGPPEDPENEPITEEATRSRFSEVYKMITAVSNASPGDETIERVLGPWLARSDPADLRYSVINVPPNMNAPNVTSVPVLSNPSGDVVFAGYQVVDDLSLDHLRYQEDNQEFPDGPSFFNRLTDVIPFPGMSCFATDSESEVPNSVDAVIIISTTRFKEASISNAYPNYEGGIFEFLVTLNGTDLRIEVHHNGRTLSERSQKVTPVPETDLVFFTLKDLPLDNFVQNPFAILTEHRL